MKRIKRIKVFYYCIPSYFKKGIKVFFPTDDYDNPKGYIITSIRSKPSRLTSWGKVYFVYFKEVI